MGDFQVDEWYNSPPKNVRKILDTIKAWNYHERMAVIGALRQYQNADKVLAYLELSGGIHKPQASYTLYPIITNIGNRTPEEYYQDAQEAVRRFEREYRQYLQDCHPAVYKVLYERNAS